MANQNWNEIGNNISQMVQSAIDSEDFSKLSQAIQNTVSTTVNSAVNGAMNGVNQGMSSMGDSINRAAQSMTKRGTVPPKAQNPWKGNGQFEKKTSDYMKAKDIPNNELYSPGTSTRAGGYLMTTMGAVGCFCFGTGLVVLMIVAGVTGANLMLPIYLVAPFLALSIWGTVKGSGVLGRFRRFKNYVRVLGSRTCVTIKELAASVGRTEKATLRDVRKMLDKDMFRQGHLDLSGKSLFVTNDGYEAYLKSQQQVETKKVKELQEAREVKSIQSDGEIPEEVKKLIADGNEYIDKIKRSNEAIQDPTVSAKLDGLEKVVSRIFQYVGRHPESANDTKKMMRYYLPTTIKLLDSYEKLNDQPVQGENIQKSKKEIENTLDTLNQAFARLFDNLYQDTSMDISSDISVLNTLLAQEGLTGNKM